MSLLVKAALALYEAIQTCVMFTLCVVLGFITFALSLAVFIAPYALVAFVTYAVIKSW